MKRQEDASQFFAFLINQVGPSINVLWRLLVFHLHTFESRRSVRARKLGIFLRLCDTLLVSRGIYKTNVRIAGSGGTSGPI